MLHGFKKPYHVLEISLRLWFGDWRLRIRDNCAYFNMMDYFALQEKQKERYGLRIVQGMVHDVQYMSALRINNVVIRIPDKDH